MPVIKPATVTEVFHFPATLSLSRKKKTAEAIIAIVATKKEIPTKITNYRAAVRDAADTIETKIDAASNMKNFIKLFDSADANGITEINRWPEEV